jgi:endo-1,4-beta-xylanase
MSTLFTNFHTTLFKQEKILLLIVFPVMILIWHLEAQPIADGKDKYLGSIINNTIHANFDSYWNQVSPENAGKWGSVESTRNIMNWTTLDQIYNYAKENGFPFREHTFVWGKQQPAWIDALDPEDQLAEVEEWIAAFGEKYPDTDFIDVVNEPLFAEYVDDPPPPYLEALGGNGETGWDWVIKAFEIAREHNPRAKLQILQYGILNGWRNINNYITIINLLKERDLIDGIGLQGHFLESASASTITSKLNQLYNATELPIYITEYDINIADDEQQLAKYEEQIPIFWTHPHVLGITLWGYIQGTMWREDGYLVRSDDSERPALGWLREYITTASSIDNDPVLPSNFTLLQNFPNPFNPVTKISYQLQQAGQVKLEVYDILGHKVKTLVNYRQSAGFHQVYWNALDELDHFVSAGVYVYRLQVKTAGNVYSGSKKMLLVK